MDPATNALIGLCFLASGVVATFLMYYLQGRPTEAKPGGASQAIDTIAPAPPERISQNSSPLPTDLRSVSGEGPGVRAAPQQATDVPKPSGEVKWYKVAETDELIEGQVKPALAGTTAIALTRHQGKHGALDAKCPHQGGPLDQGTIENGFLRCPWHGQGFNPLTGESSDPRRHRSVPAHEVQVREDGVYVAVEEPAAPATTVSDVMVETMLNWGVKHVFGMVGHSNLGLAEAIRKRESEGRITFFGVRHEGAASFACSAYAKLTGSPAACLAIAGPGATNLLTGLWDAHMDRAPVLALTGQVNTQVLGPGAFQEIDLAAAFQAVAVWSQTVLPTSNHAELVSLALKHATVQRGVGHLIFPNEVQTLPAKRPTASGPQGRLANVGIAPAADSLDKALALIGQSKRPAIIVGYGARQSMGRVIALAERLGAPVLTTFKGKGQIPDDHPLAAGVLGRSGTPVASWFMNEADLLIVFGASFSDHTGIDRDKPIIQVDFDRMALAKFHPVTVPVWGEIAITAGLLADGLSDGLAATDARTELAERWALWRAEKERRAVEDRGKGLNLATIFASLSRQVPANAVLAVDVGDNTYAFGRYFECRNQAVLLSGYLGSIGFAFPAAMGAWAAAPNRPIVSVSGDGGLGQYLAEFTTAVKYKMNITHILLNNDELGKISKEQRDGSWPVWQTSLVNPNFAEYATRCGGHGVKVTSRDELDEAIAAAVAYPGPALVDVLSDPELI